MEELSKYEKAKKKVANIKGFYNHLVVYLLVNAALLIFRTPIVVFFADSGPDKLEEGFLEWIDMNVLLTPLLWGVGLFIHYITVFGITSRVMKNWEKRKLEQFLEEEGKKDKWM